MARFKPLTIEEVKAKVKEIQKAAETEDYEAAHGMEDYLWKDVLQTIAKAPGYQDKLMDSSYKDLAIEALKTTKVKFPRSCA